MSSNLWSYLRRRPILALSAIALAPLASHIIPSYRGYLELGPGGLPYNFLGYSIQAALQPFSFGDTTDPVPFSNPKVFAAHGSHGRGRFLGEGPLPRRRGDRPVVPSYVAPQRQTTDKGDETVMSHLNAYLSELANQKPTLLIIKASVLESKDYRALHLNDNLPNYLAKTTKGEIVHVHQEASSHMVLSLADAEEATRTGWAERHKLSGKLGRLPLSYVLIYAPRDDDEFEVWKRLVHAAIGFTTAPETATDAEKQTEV
ncbi:hypothetical protein PT974_07878 [Cladobotryum mycophilum]|uniref:Luciferase domain-containing protein n=1 Tax=Cladobotryum mycophilum TaxID=491253 RepID=A0ABR0SBS7_9HYPO